MLLSDGSSLGEDGNLKLRNKFLMPLTGDNPLFVSNVRRRSFVGGVQGARNELPGECVSDTAGSTWDGEVFRGGE